MGLRYGFGGAAVLLLIGVTVWPIGWARADTCPYIPGVQNIDCSRPPQAGDLAQAGPQPACERIRDQLRGSLEDAAARRVVAAQQRIDGVIAAATQTTNPASQAVLRQEYQAELTTYRREFGAWIDTTKNPAERQRRQQLFEQQQRAYYDRVVGAGLYSRPAPAPAPAATPAAAAPIPNRYDVCKQTETQGFEICYSVPRFGEICDITLKNQRRGWEGNVDNDKRCPPYILEERNAFFRQHPDPTAEPNRPFTLNSDQTNREIRRLSSEQLSPQCQALLRNYITAARANDGQRSVAGYAALKQAGGCGVLDRAASAAPPGGDPRFEARGARPLLDQTVGACESSPDDCAARLQQLQAGASPAAVAAMYSNAIGIGLQLGTMMGNAVLAGVPVPVPAGPGQIPSGTRPIPTGHGPGSPLRPAPQQRPSDISGTDRK
jgi:hypothetical protein